MARVRLTDTERAAQIGASVALECADACRDSRDEYNYWMDAARAANDRTRMMMIERGVDVFVRSKRGGIGA